MIKTWNEKATLDTTDTQRKELMQQEINELTAENKALRDLLAEAATDVEYYAQYAGEYLSKKHNIAASVATYRAAALGEVK
jgi:hypothetical protein